MMRALAIYLGLLVLGIILAVAGWVLTPGAASFAFPGPINVAGQSLIALGLTFIVVAIGLLPAGAEEGMTAATEGPFARAPGRPSSGSQVFGLCPAWKASPRRRVGGKHWKGRRVPGPGGV